MSQNINFPCYFAGTSLAIGADVVSWLRRGYEGWILDYWYLDYFRLVIFAAVFVFVVPYGLWFLAVGTGFLVGAGILGYYGYFWD
jgi:hypothetical protein